MDINRSDLAILVSLDALLTEGSVTRAAERLGMSQPALSAQLSRMRTLFRDPLFVQSGRNLVPTERALSIQGPLHGVLQELQSIVQEQTNFDPKTATKTFRIAGTDFVHDVFTSRLARQIREDAPNARIALVGVQGAANWAELDRSNTDLLITSDRLTPPSAARLALFEESFVLVQRKRHPRGRAHLTTNALCKLEHLLVSPDGGGFYGAIDDILASLGKARRVTMSAPSFLTVPSLLRETNLVCVVPSRLAARHRATLDVFELPFNSPTFTIVASWHPRRESDAAHRWLRSKMCAAN